MTIKIFSCLAVFIGIIFTFVIMSTHSNAQSSFSSKEKELDTFYIFFSDALQHLHMAMPPSLAKDFELGADTLYVDFMPELSLDNEGNPLSLMITMEIAKPIPNRPILRILRYRGVWTTSYQEFENGTPEKKVRAIMEAADASIKLEKILLAWRWGSFQLGIDTRLTAFLAKFEYDFQPLERFLSIDASKPRRPTLVMEYVPSEKSLTIFSGFMSFLFSPFSSTPLPLPIKEQQEITTCSFVSAPFCEQMSGIIAEKLFSIFTDALPV